jgi:hypothetical protein
LSVMPSMSKVRASSSSSAGSSLKLSRYGHNSDSVILSQSLPCSLKRCIILLSFILDLVSHNTFCVYVYTCTYIV